MFMVLKLSQKQGVGFFFLRHVSKYPILRVFSDNLAILRAVKNHVSCQCSLGHCLFNTWVNNHSVTQTTPQQPLSTVTMKILSALVGYLAATALPFHPFAFASPLAAIDYDGYVNTQMWQNHTGIEGALTKHVIETYRAVIMENLDHGNSALARRMPDDIIEARQALELLSGALFVGSLLSLAAAINVGIAWVREDKPVRGNDHVNFHVEH